MPRQHADQTADQPLRDAHQIAEQFALGAPRAFSGPHARGYQAEVWKLQTESGSWAVKRSFARVDEAELQLGAEFQDAAHTAGVATRRSVRDVEGCLLADVAWGQVRIDEWVDLADSDPTIDPVAVGTTIATLHQVTTTSAGEIDPWYCVGVGADRWVETHATTPGR